MTDLEILKQLTKEYQILGIEQKYKLNENNRVIEIYITGLNITHLDLFSSLESLEILFLSGNKIKNITPLKKLKKLKKLGLNEIATSDFSSLQELKNLEYLCLNKNKIKDISFIKNLKKLKRLELKDNDVSYILSLKNLILLEHLDLRSNQISEISILTNLKKLNNLYLSNNYIEDISLLKNLKNLKNLYLDKNNIIDSSSLKKLENLNLLNLEYNQNLDISTLKNFKAIRLNINISKRNKGYLKEIEIKNYFSLKDVKIKDLANKKEVYFLGENGEGKTILLQSILLALSHSQDGNIINLIESTKDKLELKAIDNFNFQYDFTTKYSNQLENIFAYGVGRLRTSENIDTIDTTAYMSLFNNNTVLQHPIHWFEKIDRLDAKKIGILKIKDVLKNFENLLENKVEIKEIKETGEFIFIEKGTKLKFDQLADGYKSVLIWLADLLSRLTEKQPEVTKLEDYHGIVLVDEIDILLHPRWQYKIVKKLRSLFPKIQWIFTTHSPIITLGASKDAVFYKVYKENGETKISEPVKDISNLMANTILTSPLFALETARQSSFDEKQGNLSLDDDYAWAKIHEAVSLKIQKEHGLKEDDIMDFILNELENLDNDTNQ